MNSTTAHAFKSTASIEKRENAKYRRNLRKENNRNKYKSGSMGDKNVLVPGNLEWDEGTGSFKEAAVKKHPIDGRPGGDVALQNLG